jgi:dipeptidyl aminopeptidase/acylaminoacyl peptidase
VIRRLPFFLLAGVLGGSAVAGAGRMPPPVLRKTRQIRIDYVAHNGVRRAAYVLVPKWYSPATDPPLPLVISPHGRGVDARVNARLWGDLPGRVGFAVVNPEGQGRRLELYSWGDAGQISDLARMPKIVQHALPWLHVDPHRIFAAGGSMGGQETLLLVARHPHLLAGAISFDAPTDLSLRYREFHGMPYGHLLQRLARYEVGGTPAADPSAWSRRSPLDFARAIARSRVPLEIWWSRDDRIVPDQAEQSGRLYRLIMRLDPAAPVRQVVGWWHHCAEIRTHLRKALAFIGLG